MSNENKLQNDISNLAYSLWDNAGRPAHRDLEFWLEAEKQVFQRAGSETVAPSASSVPALKAERAVPSKAIQPAYTVISVGTGSHLTNKRPLPGVKVQHRAK